ncbi:MAG TPA: glycosyltransferase family 4 protein [Planctomycetota bacterium]|nr:glycosyltransferase family 4 protein [Planctomycetota bacterium]
MQLLHLTPYVAHPLHHGGRIRSRQLLRAAVGAGHRVVNVALSRGPAETAGADALRAEGVDVRTVEVPPAPPALTQGERLVKWARLLAGRSSLLPRWRHDLAAAEVARVVRETPIDLAVIDTPWMDVYRSELRGIPYVASTQNVEGDVLAAAAATLGPAAAWAAARDAAILLAHERRWTRGAAAVVAVSDEDARRFGAMTEGCRTVVAPNGVDVETLRPLGDPPADGPLLFVASYDYPPNADAARWFVRDVLPAVRATLGPVEAVLAGREPDAEVRALAQTPGVRVTGAVDELGPLYRAARAVVAPLRFGGGSRLKILEAFAYGRPVVATGPGAAGLAARPGRELLVADDAAGFAAALGRLRDERGLAASLATAAREFVETRHGWPASRAAYLAALDAAARAIRPRAELRRGA